MNNTASEYNQKNNKYIKVLQRTVRVKIERGSDKIIKHFRIRDYSSLSDAVEAARAWRDTKHLELFSIPVLNVVHKLRNIKPASVFHDHKTGNPLPDLPAGLSWGFHRKKLLYVVVSVKKGGVPIKKRFSIEKLGIDEAIRIALDFRLDSIVEQR